MGIDEILEKIKDKDYAPQTAEKLIKIFGIEEFNIPLFMKNLAELEEKGLIMLTKKSKYITLEKRGYFSGVLTANVKGFAFFKKDGAKDEYFIPNKDLKGALDKDRVLVSLISNAKGKNREAKVEKILKRGTKGFVGILTYFRNQLIIEPEDRRIFGRYTIENPEKGMQKGERIFVAITEYGQQKRMGKVKLMTKLETSGESVEAIIENILLRNGLAEEFPEAVLAESNKIPQTVTESLEEGRRDLRALQMVTIDGEDAKDFDDAVSIELLDNGNYKLGVHITDVSHYVKESSHIDKEAFKRGTSIYFPGRVLPMLPVALSNGICSLNAGVDRMAMTAMMEINNKGKVVNYEIFPSLIKVEERMTYTNVAKILRGEDEEILKRYEHLIGFFNEMSVLADILGKKREKRGSLFFDLPELKVNVDENAKPISLSICKRNKAESIIEEFMLAANETVAEHLYWLEFPCVYRIHESPPLDGITHFNEVMGPFDIKIVVGGSGEIHPKIYQEIIKKIQNHPMKNMIMNLLLRSMSHARYDVEPLGHFGLSVTYYCHFTSPIRRYPDLAVHRSLKASFQGAGMSIKKKLMARDIVVAAEASEWELVAESVERKITTVKVVEYMKLFVGESFNSRVSGMIRSGIFVQLENLAEGFIPFATLNGYHVFSETEMVVRDGGNQVSFKIGDSVRVKLVAANIGLGHLDFIIEDDNNDENS